MAFPAISSTDPTTTASTAYPTDIYQRLCSYSFTTDPEFKLGIATILGQSGTPATDEQVNRTDDLVVKAKCFYFSKKFSIQPPIDYLSYKQWLQQQPLQTNDNTPPSSNINTIATAPEATSISTTQETSKSEEEQPVYPSSFARIVELITTGQPIPGIQQIPDTVLTGQETTSTAQRRRKPWETDAGEQKGGKEEGKCSDIVENGDGSGLMVTQSIDS
ncbi:uncharacterized protein GIQ15_06538 [Arthroderma uncinatum]|uniref:uncharacterized protein n=1 Tax=Arthroderma uncinatum TaxID=74035 RepID=UPI00144A8E55|nr:uncharacterized protein GIQ15_06538 [Arthroderma uncinatum]KAF3479562.1 hypothetical protein GIQ15_06538 [Arthroderma uncinatum]